MMSTSIAKILIVDDHPMVREGLAGRIASEPDLEVCGEAVDVDDALQQTKELLPDLIIVDISLKTSHGIDLIKQLKSSGRGAHLKVLVHTMYTESLYADRALQAGADGYITKQEAPEQVILAIREILRGNIYLSTEMSQRVLSRAVGRGNENAAPTAEKLSDRELEIFRLIGEGLTTGQIASRLHLSTHTIHTHRENIKHKLELHNAAELNRAAVRWVLENG
ncbi:MAG: response regulator transcription factor [Planctomycetaceae bacterium]|nr:response regulator transcription factor [Planctomycetaceae bacterium]